MEIGFWVQFLTLVTGCALWGLVGYAFTPVYVGKGEGEYGYTAGLRPGGRYILIGVGSLFFILLAYLTYQFGSRALTTPVAAFMGMSGYHIILCALAWYYDAVKKGLVYYTDHLWAQLLCWTPFVAGSLYCLCKMYLSPLGLASVYFTALFFIVQIAFFITVTLRSLTDGRVKEIRRNYLSFYNWLVSGNEAEIKHPWKHLLVQLVFLGALVSFVVILQK